MAFALSILVQSFFNEFPHFQLATKIFLCFQSYFNVDEGVSCFF